MVEPGLNPVNLEPKAILLSSTSQFHKLWPRGQVQAIFIKKLFLEHIHPLPLHSFGFCLWLHSCLQKQRPYGHKAWSVFYQILSEKNRLILVPHHLLKSKEESRQWLRGFHWNQPEPTVRNNSLCQPIQDSVGWWKENVALRPGQV